jgi:putative phosphoribosyl transferase
VPVAYEVAAALEAPLDVIMVRKLGVPFQPELGMGAIGEDGARVINDEIVRAAGVSQAQIAEVEEQERAELDRRARRFRGDRPRVPLDGRTAVIVDDGIATGSTARAACHVARAHGAARVVLAVPVAPVGWTERLGGDADELVCLDTPDPFMAIGQFYADFSQTPDEDVVACLQRATHAPSRADDPPARDDDVEVQAGNVRLGGHLTVPPGAPGIVVFAHGSGSSRHSPRNRYVASVLNRAGLGTLLLDLLTTEEERDRTNVFDVELLAGRLTGASGWLRADGGAGDARLGYFGASTGAAAALRAAAEPDAGIAAVVSRGGRPDLAGARLPLVTAPTLLIVGGLDEVVLGLNREALAQLEGCESQLLVIPGATHLFEEPGTLEAAAEAAARWFTAHLGVGTM